MYARWISILETYEYEIQHRPGAKHRNADGISRIPTRKCKRSDCPDCTSYLKTDDHQYPHEQSVNQINVETQSDKNDDRLFESNWLENLSTSEIARMQENDPSIGPILKLKRETATKPSRDVAINLSNEARILLGHWETLEIVDGVLYRRNCRSSVNNSQLQLVVAKEMRLFIFEQLHGNRIAGHFGRDRTIEAISRRYYWPNQYECLKRWCQECDVCARCKPGPGLGKSPLKQLHATAPMRIIAIDIFGPLPITDNGNEYIIVIGDYYTKWKEAFSVPNHTALTVADKLVTEMICKFGCPEQIHTDQGREFESNLFKSVCEKLGINKTRTTPYRPQSDGLVERFNRTLRQMLSMFVHENQRDWDDHLPYLLMAYRSTAHKSTGCTPNLLMLGRENDCPIDIVVGPPPDRKNEECPIKYVEWMQTAMMSAFEFAHDNLGDAATIQKKGYDSQLKIRSYDEGSWVWRWYPPTAGIKLGLGWTGPYLVICKLSDLLYTIQKSQNSPKITVHVDHLKPYVGSNAPESWIVSERNVIPQMIDDDDVISPDAGDENEVVNDANEEGLNESNPIIITKTKSGRVVKPKDRYSP
ncbi:hypothetical protein FSP39_001056 [Pinctada imbricata]|uniref:Integrase catalytic domain-containing protein n=1 Tax=Pinctada imbricata TaxID=66713 RepID=A0AA88YI36_PINIB|nr:hypothetical protein FSP39_001056 [Pinctada imbricata]